VASAAAALKPHSLSRTCCQSPCRLWDPVAGYLDEEGRLGCQGHPGGSRPGPSPAVCIQGWLHRVCKCVSSSAGSDLVEDYLVSAKATVAAGATADNLSTAVHYDAYIDVTDGPQRALL
jgi:hypothetical protein